MPLAKRHYVYATAMKNPEVSPNVSSENQNDKHPRTFNNQLLQTFRNV